MQKFTQNFADKYELVQDANGEWVPNLLNFKTLIIKESSEIFIVATDSKENQNIGFFKLLKKLDLADSLELYESDNTFQNWKQLSLNASETIINEKPCEKPIKK
jgi:hypothetical protein